MGRKGSGIEVRGENIRVAYTIDGVRKKRTLFVEGAPLRASRASLAHARKLAVEIQDRIRLGVFVESDYFPVDGGDVGRPGVGVLVQDQLKLWLDAQRLAPSTRKAYQSAVNFWSAHLGATPLKRLQHSAVLTVIADKGGHLNGKTVNNYVSVLREACSLAVLDRVLAYNPVVGVKRAKRQKPEADPFAPAEVEAILAHMAKKYSPQIANHAEFKFFTGLRSSEAYGLRWENVDLAGKYVVVKEAIVRGSREARTKTDTVRKVLLNTRALATIKRQAAHTRLAGEYVFHDPRYDQRWADERAFRRSFWKPTLKALGMRYRPPYNTRHTYATMMLMAGMTPAFCAKQLGHSVEMFLGTYSKWLDGTADKVEMAKLEASWKAADAASATN